MAITIAEEIPAAGVNFDAEAENLAGTPKQSYIEDINFEENTDQEGPQSAESYASDQDAQDPGTGGGKAYNSAKLAFTITDMVIPRLAAMKLKTSSKRFRAKPEDKEDLIQLWTAWFEYHNYNFDDPNVALIIGLGLAYGVPIYEYVQEKPGNTEPKAAPAPKADEAEPVQAEEVSDEDLQRENQRTKAEVIGAVNTKGERVCAWRECDNVLTKTQKKYCSHKCRAHGSNESR